MGLKGFGVSRVDEADWGQHDGVVRVGTGHRPGAAHLGDAGAVLGLQVGQFELVVILRAPASVLTPGLCVLQCPPVLPSDPMDLPSPLLTLDPVLSNAPPSPVPPSDPLTCVDLPVSPADLPVPSIDPPQPLTSVPHRFPFPPSAPYHIHLLLHVLQPLLLAAAAALWCFGGGWAPWPQLVALLGGRSWGSESRLGLGVVPPLPPPPASHCHPSPHFLPPPLPPGVLLSVPPPTRPSVHPSHGPSPSSPPRLPPPPSPHLLPHGGSWWLPAAPSGSQSAPDLPL